MSRFAGARDIIGRFISPELQDKLLWLGNATVDMVFPPRCLHCGRVDTWWCDMCHQALGNLPIEVVSLKVSGIAQVVTTSVHDGICQDAIQGLKYHGQQGLSVTLGQRLVRVLTQMSWTFDMIIPVPIHTTRIAERGYNHSKYLGDVIHHDLGIELVDDALIKTQATRPQVGLTRAERLVNLEGVFDVDNSRIRGRRVLLVDDVTTTGATLGECAKVLRTNGVTEVYAITVSGAPGS